MQKQMENKTYHILKQFSINGKTKTVLLRVTPTVTYIILTFYLTYVLTFYRANLLAFYLTHIFWVQACPAASRAGGGGDDEKEETRRRRRRRRRRMKELHL
jgi:hypothetical protein